MEVNKRNGASGAMPFDEETCERYLFGELNDTDRERFEMAYFADDAFFDRFLAVKTELLDLYTRGELDPQRTLRLKSHFLSTTPRQRHVAEFSMFTREITTIAGRRDASKNATLASSIEPGAEQKKWLETLFAIFTFQRISLATAGLIVAAGVVILLSRPVSETASEQAVREPDNPVFPANPSADETRNPESQNDLTKKIPVPFAGRSPIPPQGAEDQAKKLVRSRLDNKKPVNERAESGFALTLSTVGRDNSRPIGAAPDIGGAQNREGMIDVKGTVLDLNENGVPGAIVTARNIKTGMSRSVTSEPDGTYSFSNMPPGKYEISSTAPNLRRAAVSPIELSARKTYALDISLLPGSVDSVVNVMGDEVATGRLSSVTLMASTRDTADSNVLKIYSDTTRVQIKLSFARFDFASYRVGIESVAGTRVFSAKDLNIIGPELSGGIPLEFDAKMFKASDYIVKLSGRTKAGISEVISEYYMKVQRIASKTPQSK
jgi:Carboxypeptidase regulatory-like domain